MSCNQCGTKFNFFHKEFGCPNCGLSLCNKCLKHKCKIPSKGAEEFSVCRSCYVKLTTCPEVQEVFYPPDKFLKRLENLENPSAPPITVYKESARVHELKSGLSMADQNLVDRLEKLKEKQIMPPTDSDIKQRLAKLKGENLEDSMEAKPFYVPDVRTDQQKVDSLLEQFSCEENIKMAHTSMDDLDERLATLKGQEHKKSKVAAVVCSDDQDSEEEIDQITKKVMAEVSLNERIAVDNIPEKSKNEDDEALRSSPELPWCVLCNNDAKYRCLDCSGDLYCSSCNAEVHKTWGETDHRIIPYKQT